MAMQTGEDEKGLRKIMDMTRAVSILILVLHCYYFWNSAFVALGIHFKITDMLISQIGKTGLFRSFNTSKNIALLLLVISLFGTKGRNDEKLSYKTAFAFLALGAVIYYTSYFVAHFEGKSTSLVFIYLTWTLAGYLLFIIGGAYLSRIIKVELSEDDIFNKENQTFPQDEELRYSEYSVNLPARYRLKNKWRKSWINIINPFRGLLVIGSPGSGKSYFVIEEVIRQHIEKGFAMFVYDFKYDDLTRITYQAFQKYKGNYKVTPEFYSVNFEDLSRSHRCNPLDPTTMEDITDAMEASRTILLSLNRNWISKQGDFFVESSVNFLAACIWFLAKYEKGNYCTLPHVIELMQLDYDKLFTVLRTEPEIETLISPFVNAYLSDVMETLESQIATPKISLGRLVSPTVYYILSGNDFSLAINCPLSPKIVCMGNNPQKQQVYGAILSLYISKLIKNVNKKGGNPCSLIFDEFPTIYFNGIDSLIATARSNLISTTMVLQDYSQLKKDYGKEMAEVVMNIVGNIICGQVTGDTARQLSERFGKIFQQKSSLSISSTDISINKSKQLDTSIPASVISNLSSGEFVGTIADNPTDKISLKKFHCEIIKDNDRKRFKYKNSAFLPGFKKISNEVVQTNYSNIKSDICLILEHITSLLSNDPLRKHLIINKGQKEHS
jgi:YWFCY protein/Type IV secretory system Conjugative DNA transfer